MEIEDYVEITNFAKGPITKLPINEEVWTVSILNLKQRNKIKEVIDNKWKEKYPNIPIPKEEPTPIASQNFQEMKEEIEETEEFKKYINKLDPNQITNIKCDTSKEKFIEDKWKEKYPNTSSPAAYKKLQDIISQIKMNGFSNIERDLHSAILFEGRGDVTKEMNKVVNYLKNMLIPKFKDVLNENFKNEFQLKNDVLKISSNLDSEEAFIKFLPEQEDFIKFSSDFSLFEKIEDISNKILKNTFSSDSPLSKKMEDLKNTFSSDSPLSKKMEDIANKVFGILFKGFFKNTPKFKPDENETWMLMVDLVPQDPNEKLEGKNKYLFDKKGGEIRFRKTKFVKKITLGHIFDEEKDILKQYELIKSFNILAEDGFNGIIEAYLNQSTVSFSRAKPIVTHIVRSLGFPIDVLNCSFFSTAIIRCCGIVDSIFDTIFPLDRTLFGNDKGENSIKGLSPSILRTSQTTHFYYVPSDKEKWKRILPMLVENQKHIDPNFNGIDIIDYYKSDAIGSIGDVLNDIKKRILYKFFYSPFREWKSGIN